MAEDRGRALKDRLEKAQNEYNTINVIVKRLIKSEENSIHSKESLKRKLLEVAHLEPNESVSMWLGSLSKGIEKIVSAQRESLQRIKNQVGSAVKRYPDRVKQQRRSLSESRRAGMDFEKRSKTYEKLQERSKETDPSEIEKAANELKEAKGAADYATSTLEKDFSGYSQSHYSDFRLVLLHLINAQMHTDASSIDALTSVIKEISKS